MRLAILFNAAMVAVASLFVAAPGHANDIDDIIKYIQPPDMETGFDQQSQWDYTDGEPDVIKADDWICPDGRPITDIHWWGSYYNNEEFQPVGFFVSIYANDDKALVGDPSDDMPGELLWGDWYTFADSNQTFFGIDSVGEAVYAYTAYVPEGFWFEQEQGVKYWLSIVADTPEMGSTPIWGWHTGFEPDRLEGLLTDAVTGKVLIGENWAAGNPEEWAHEDYNFAFALTTIPEPGTMLLLGSGLLALFGVRRRK